MRMVRRMAIYRIRWGTERGDRSITSKVRARSEAEARRQLRERCGDIVIDQVTKEPA